MPYTYPEDNEPFRDGCRLGPNATILPTNFRALDLFIEYLC